MSSFTRVFFFTFFCIASMLALPVQSLASERESLFTVKMQVGEGANAGQIDAVWGSAAEITDAERSRIWGHLKEAGPEQIVQIMVPRSRIEEGFALAEELSTRGVISDVRTVPDEFVRKTSTEEAGFRSRLKASYVAPTRSEWTLGLTIGTFRFVSSGIIWLSVGLSPPVAAALTIAQTANTVFQAAYVRTFDNLFSSPTRRDRQRDLARSSTRREFWRRQAWGLGWTELWRAISGPTGDAHSVTSLLGQGEILSIQAAWSMAALFSAERNKNLSRKGSTWANFNFYMITSVVGMLDFAGVHFMKLADFGFYQLNLSTVMLFGTIVGLVQLVKKKPQFFEKLAEWEENLLNRARNAISWSRTRVQGLRGGGSRCNSLYAF